MSNQRRAMMRQAAAQRAGAAPGVEGFPLLCSYCGFDLYIDWPIDGPVRIQSHIDERGHLDHIVPTSRNGPDSLDNIAIVCQDCNLAKGDASFGDPIFQEWLARQRRVVSAL